MFDLYSGHTESQIIPCSCQEDNFYIECTELRNDIFFGLLTSNELFFSDEKISAFLPELNLLKEKHISPKLMKEKLLGRLV